MSSQRKPGLTMRNQRPSQWLATGSQASHQMEPPTDFEYMSKVERGTSKTNGSQVLLRSRQRPFASYCKHVSFESTSRIVPKQRGKMLNPNTTRNSPIPLPSVLLEGTTLPGRSLLQKELHSSTQNRTWQKATLSFFPWVCASASSCRLTANLA